MGKKKTRTGQISNRDKTDVPLYSYKPHPILSDLLEEYIHETGLTKTDALDLCVSGFFAKQHELARALMNIIAAKVGDE